MAETTSPKEEISEGIVAISGSLGELEALLRRVEEGAVHRADPGGGWTASQVVTHIGHSTMLWVALFERLRRDPELAFVWREELGHDVVGYAPPTAELCAGRIATTRRTIETCFTDLDEALLERSCEFPDVGTVTIGFLTPLLIGHLQAHVDQVHTILRSRGVHPD